MRSEVKNKHIGSGLDEFLAEEHLLEASQTVAIKRMLAWQVAQLMEQQALSKSEMADRMGTSRSALDRLLDPENDSVTLKTLQNAARAVGAQLEIKLVFSGAAA
ncbi:MAG: XRE family transcriptional regulator [Lysobacterales bacterium]|jgi:predicted XRE-type DNA-binding protein